MKWTEKEEKEEKSFAPEVRRFQLLQKALPDGEFLGKKVFGFNFYTELGFFGAISSVDVGVDLYRIKIENCPHNFNSFYRELTPGEEFEGDVDVDVFTEVSIRDLADRLLRGTEKSPIVLGVTGCGNEAIARLECVHFNENTEFVELDGFNRDSDLEFTKVYIRGDWYD